VGYNEEGLVYIIMVEGYEVQDSGGMTRQELADLFLRLGATQAMEFDGGGSSSLVLGPNGRISDVGWEGERRVSNALLVFWEED
jgi:exopolysaccharide biosynthesis protein